jgi:hypothetical protein
MKKGSNPMPPKGMKRPPAPPAPPMTEYQRGFRDGLAAAEKLKMLRDYTEAGGVVGIIMSKLKRTKKRGKR